MNKLLLLLAICSFQFQSSLASSCKGENAFCDINFSNPTHHIFIGKILQHDSTSSKFEVTDRIRGVELKDTLIIWNFNDTLLPGINFHSATSNSIGNVGDTILIILGKITNLTQYNQHASIGDYFAPSNFCGTPFLRITNGLITGNLTKFHPYTSPLTPYVIDSIAISDFKSQFNPSAGAINCDLSVGFQENSKEVELTISPNPFQNYIQIDSQVELKNVTIFDILGKMVFSSNAIRNNRINLEDLEAGIFFLTAETKSGEKISKKLIKD